MAAKKKQKKAAKPKKKAKKLHHIKVGNGKPVPRSLPGVKHNDSVSITKSDKADRFADFPASPFFADERPFTHKIPFKGTIKANPPAQKSYHYDVLDKDGKIVSNKASGPPNPPEIVVG
jgi:hypothetical protein